MNSLMQRLRRAQLIYGLSPLSAVAALAPPKPKPLTKNQRKAERRKERK